jgi:hypothetical protein
VNNLLLKFVYLSINKNDEKNEEMLCTHHHCVATQVA